MPAGIPTLAERVTEIFAEHPELQNRQTELAKVAGVGRAWVNQWISGLAKSMSYDAAKRINAAYGYSIDWLMDGIGPKGAPRLMASDVEPEELPIAGDQVPVVGYVMGGDRGFFDEPGYATGHGEGYVTYPTKDKNTYALRVRGDSMRPRAKPGEYVVVMPNQPVNSGDEVVVRTKDGRVMVKVLGPRRGGLVELQSINELDHPPITLEEHEIEKMHYVGGIAKDYLYRSSI